ncbi:MAG: hypothetical protein KAH07_03885 [Flavobacteriaceae bacterium]|nr:hypothetical protein [Flavobacteriaceae bacterium]
MFGKAFKPSKFYVFDYKPRYYDERKERIANLKKEQQASGNAKSEGGITLTKNNLKNNWVKSTKAVSNRSANRRLVIIIALLSGIAAYILELHTLF